MTSPSDVATRPRHAAHPIHRPAPARRIEAVLGYCKAPGGWSIVHRAVRLSGSDAAPTVTVCAVPTTELATALAREVRVLRTDASRSGAGVSMWVSGTRAAGARVRASLQDVWPANDVEMDWGVAPASLLALVGERVVAELKLLTATPLDVATDASVGIGRAGVGLACVATDGTYRQKFVDEKMTTNLAEIMAIGMAVKRYNGRCIHVRTDSQSAVRVIRGESEVPSGATDSMARIMKAVGLGLLTVEWVKGHADDLLNATADRLCVAARRAADLNLDPAMQETVATRIVQEYLLTVRDLPHVLSV